LADAEQPECVTGDAVERDLGALVGMEHLGERAEERIRREDVHD
jgi:hypothetical protein